MVVLWPCGLARERWRACVSVSGAYPRLAETRSCTAADKFVSHDPDQSYYQFWSRPKPLPTWLCRCGPTWPNAWLSAPHTDAAPCDGLECCVHACGVSCWIPQEENMSCVISNIKLCLRFVFYLHRAECFPKACQLMHKAYFFLCSFHTHTFSCTNTFTKPCSGPFPAFWGSYVRCLWGFYFVKLWEDSSPLEECIVVTWMSHLNVSIWCTSSTMPSNSIWTN